MEINYGKRKKGIRKAPPEKTGRIEEYQSVGRAASYWKETSFVLTLMLSYGHRE
jgi:hypothetical protein